MGGDELYQTLQSKMYAGERLNDDEKMWLSMLSRKDIRRRLKGKPSLGDDPLD